MSLRLVGACAAMFFSILLLAASAHARKACYCEVAVGCPKGSHVDIVDFGQIASYPSLSSQKKQKCATACAQASAAAAPGILAQGDTWCDTLGVGTHDVMAYSVVGRTDSYNNWCSPDDVIGALVCTRSCDCPAGFTYDPAIDLCRGTCGGLPVITYHLGCGLDHAWQ